MSRPTPPNQVVPRVQIEPVTDDAGTRSGSYRVRLDGEPLKVWRRQNGARFQSWQFTLAELVSIAEAVEAVGT